MSRHQTESREDLVFRFETFGRYLLAARERSCAVARCPSCALIDAPLDVTNLVAEGHEPREDLERATEALAGRMGAIVTSDGAEDCGRAGGLLNLYAEAARRQGGQHGDAC